MTNSSRESYQLMKKISSIQRHCNSAITAKPSSYYNKVAGGTPSSPVSPATQKKKYPEVLTEISDKSSGDDVPAIVTSYKNNISGTGVVQQRNEGGVTITSSPHSSILPKKRRKLQWSELLPPIKLSLGDPSSPSPSVSITKVEEKPSLMDSECDSSFSSSSSSLSVSIMQVGEEHQQQQQQQLIKEEGEEIVKEEEGKEEEIAKEKEAIIKEEEEEEEIVKEEEEKKIINQEEGEEEELVKEEEEEKIVKAEKKTSAASACRNRIRYIMSEYLCEKHKDGDHNLLVFSGVSLPSESDVKLLQQGTKMDLNVADPVSHSGIALSNLKKMIVDVIRVGGRKEVAWVAREIHMFCLLNPAYELSNNSFVFRSQPFREIVHTLLYIIVMYCNPKDIFVYSLVLSMVRKYYDSPYDNFIFLGKCLEFLRQTIIFYGTSTLAETFTEACKGTSKYYKMRIGYLLLSSSGKPRSIVTHTKKMEEAIHAGDTSEAAFRLSIIFRLITKRDLQDTIPWLEGVFPDKCTPLSAAVNLKDRRMEDVTNVLFSELWDSLTSVAIKIHPEHYLAASLALVNSVAVRRSIFASLSNYMPVDKLACLLSCVMSLANEAANAPYFSDFDDVHPKLQLVWKLSYDPSFVWHTGHTVTRLGDYVRGMEVGYSETYDDVYAVHLKEEREQEYAECRRLYDPEDIELPPVDRPLCPNKELVENICNPKFFPNSVGIYASTIATHNQPPLETGDVATGLQELSVKENETITLYKDKSNGMIDVLSMRADSHSQFGLDLYFYNNLCRKLKIATHNGRYGLRVHNINNSPNVAFDQEMGQSWLESEIQRRKEGGSVTVEDIINKGVLFKMRLFALIVLQLILGMKKDLQPSDFVYNFEVGDIIVSKIKCVGMRTAQDIMQDNRVLFSKVINLCLPLPHNWLSLLPKWCQGLFFPKNPPLTTPFDFMTFKATPTNSLRLKPSTYEFWEPGECCACLSAEDGYKFRDGVEIKMYRRCAREDADEDCDSDSDHGFDYSELKPKLIKLIDCNSDQQRNYATEKFERLKNKHAFEDSHMRKINKVKNVAITALHSMRVSQDFIARQYGSDNEKRAMVLHVPKKRTSKDDTLAHELLPLTKVNVTFGTQDLVNTIVDVAAESGFINRYKLDVIIKNVHTVSDSLRHYLTFDSKPARLFAMCDDKDSRDEH